MTAGSVHRIAAVGDLAARDLAPPKDEACQLAAKPVEGELPPKPLSSDCGLDSIDGARLARETRAPMVLSRPAASSVFLSRMLCRCDTSELVEPCTEGGDARFQQRAAALRSGLNAALIRRHEVDPVITGRHLAGLEFQTLVFQQGFPTASRVGASALFLSLPWLPPVRLELAQDGFFLPPLPQKPFVGADTRSASVYSAFAVVQGDL